MFPVGVIPPALSDLVMARFYRHSRVLLTSESGTLDWHTDSALQQWTLLWLREIGM